MWKPTKNQKFGVVIYNFHHDEILQALRLDVGETVQILEECQGWYRGFSTRSRNVKGVFPASFIHLKPFRIDNEGIYETVNPVEDSVGYEAANVLREWGHIWKTLYVKYNPAGESVELWEWVRSALVEVAGWRKQIITGTLTSDQMSQLKLKITRKIDVTNKKLGLDLVPRVDGQMVDPDAVSVVELYQVHVLSAETSLAHSQGLSTLSKRKERRKILSHHLFFCMRDFSYHLGEDAEIFFSLYDAQKSKFISERFLVKLSKEGFSNYVERIHSNCTIFTDLGGSDLMSDLYIIAHVIRVGRMLFSESVKKTSSQFYRRPHGVALFKLGPNVLQGVDGGEVELTGKLFTSDEKDFWQLHDLVLKKQSNKYSIMSNNASYGLVVSVKLVHGELEQATKENPLLLKNVCITKKLGFSDVIMPGDVRNDLYITLNHGEFERGGKSTGKNIEVTVLALDSQGMLLPCIYSGMGHDGMAEYYSMIMYHNNSPRWNERLKVAIPIDQFAGAHLRLEYRHCSTREKNEKKMFGFSFVRLMDDEVGTTHRDGPHELCIYKCDDRSRLANPAEYLTMPFLSRDAVDCIYSLPYQRSPKEFIEIETLLCSTKLTQNVDLLSLLRWRSAPEGIGETLSRVTRVEGAETVKFLQDVLDALFAMFSTDDGNSTQHSGHVFQALVSIFSLLEDSKFEHFKPVMDAYITGHFAAALVYKGLISCVKHLANVCPQTEKQEPIVRCFRSLEYIFKFIIQSRLLFARATGGQNEDSFREDINGLFDSFTKLLSQCLDNVQTSQVNLLENIQGGCDQLARALSPANVAGHLCEMINCVTVGTREVARAKLKAMRNAVTSTLFDDDDARQLLLETSCRHLRSQLDSRLELRLCSDIISDIIILTHKHTAKYQHQKLPATLHKDVETLMLLLIDIIVESILALERTAPSSGALVACLMGILQLMSEAHYTRLWEMHLAQGTFSLRHLLQSKIQLLTELVRTGGVFSEDWFVMRMVSNHTILTAMQEIAQPLIATFLKNNKFDNQLWSSYLNLAVAFLTQPSLQLEHFSEQKRHKVLERYNDMRVLMGFQILSMWHNLDEQRLHFIPGMVGPFLEVTLVPEPELRKATLPIFFDMMQAEQLAKGNFKQVETELIDKLDILVSENKGDDEYRQLFNTILLEHVRSDDPVWRESGTAFINSVTRLLERLLDYRNVMQGDENCDKRMSCTVNLLNFYKNEINREEMYIRYIYKLHDLHIPADNYTEAAFTLHLHADHLEWTGRMLHQDHLYAAQTESQRKELIYKKIIDYFDKGKCWERGIPLLEELATLYRSSTFSYSSLAEVLRQQAVFYDKILHSPRHEIIHFKVGFFGLGLPLFVRNKVFIYRGMEFEQISGFSQRIQTEFPQAKMLHQNTPPDDTIRSSDGHFVQICTVKPVPEPNPQFEGVEVNDCILMYYNSNQLRKFLYDRPMHRGVQDKENEFKTLWIERTHYQIECELPGILKWFEVTEQHIENICPPQYACETVTIKNKELRQMILLYRANTKENIQPFTMRLQGTIDAAVNGGIAKYQDAFFDPEYVVEFPEFSVHVSKLKVLISDQVSILEVALELHGRIAPTANQALHRHLVEVFEEMRAKVRRMCSTPGSQRSTSSLQQMTSASATPPGHHHTHRRADSDPPTQEFRRTGSIINSPLPPVPVDKLASGSSASTSGHSSQRSSQASSIYAHFHSASHDEDLYAKPQEQWDDSNLSLRESRPRSALMTDSRSSSPKSLSRSLNSDYMAVPATKLSEENRRWRNSRPPSPRLGHRDSLNTSWSDSHGSHESLPPLPPRVSGERGDRSSRSVSLSGEDDHVPPILPKRVGKKSSSPSMFGSEQQLSEYVDHYGLTNINNRASGDSGIRSSISSGSRWSHDGVMATSRDSSMDGTLPNGTSASTPDTPPLLSPRNHRTPPPPPIPPKTTTSTPITPLQPPDNNAFSCNEDLTPTNPMQFQDSDFDGSRANMCENYSVPPRLQSLPPSNL